MSIQAVPSELLIEVLRYATYIPGEWDDSVPVIDFGTFGAVDNLTITAYETVLPLRLDIVLVCRLWYSLGAEFLYGTFWHRIRGDYHSTDARKLKELLQERPEIGRLVRRLLSQPTDGELGRPSPDDLEIIRGCPNLTHLSIELSLDEHKPTSFFEALPLHNLRHLELQVFPTPLSLLITALRHLQQLEVLYIIGEAEREYTDKVLPNATLPALQVVRINLFDAYHNLEWTLLSCLDLPRLTALLCSLVITEPYRAKLRTLTHLDISSTSQLHIEPKSFPLLRSLRVIALPKGNLPEFVNSFPLGQIQVLSVRIQHPPETLPPDRIDRMVELPLNTDTMPALRTFELQWGASSIRTTVLKEDSSIESKMACLEIWDDVTTRFERRGVEFIEYPTDLLEGSVTVRKTVESCRAQLTRS